MQGAVSQTWKINIPDHKGIPQNCYCSLRNIINELYTLVYSNQGKKRHLRTYTVPVTRLLNNATY